MVQFVFPDPRDRSPKRPTARCDRLKIVGLWNHAKGDNRERLVEDIKEWFKSTAIQKGWKEVVFDGQGATLTADVRVFTPDDDDDPPSANVVRLRRKRA